MDNTNTEKKQPEKEFSAGVISTAVWKNLRKDGTGKEIETRTITLQKRYKLGDEWKKTSNLNQNDLPKAILLLQKSFDFLVTQNGNSGVAEIQV